jgi:hypothetical protein
VTRRVHVVGAGLAGLACAVRLSEAPGLRVTLHEASPKAGGRCRSYHDARLDRRIDNGNHLILSGNGAVLDYARRIGGAGRLEALPDAAFPFVDLAGGARWTVRAPRSPLGVWRRGALPPGAGAGDPPDALRLLLAGPGRTVADVLRGRGAMWRAFWEPMTTAVLNAPPERASAALLRAALVRTFFRGGAACRPVLAPRGSARRWSIRRCRCSARAASACACARRWRASPRPAAGRGASTLRTASPRRWGRRMWWSSPSRPPPLRNCCRICPSPAPAWRS